MDRRNDRSPRDVYQHLQRHSRFRGNDEGQAFGLAPLFPLRRGTKGVFSGEIETPCRKKARRSFLKASIPLARGTKEPSSGPSKCRNAREMSTSISQPLSIPYQMLNVPRNLVQLFQFWPELAASIFDHHEIHARHDHVVPIVTDTSNRNIQHDDNLPS